MSDETRDDRGRAECSAAERIASDAARAVDLIFAVGRDVLRAPDLGDNIADTCNAPDGRVCADCGRAMLRSDVEYGYPVPDGFKHRCYDCVAQERKDEDAARRDAYYGASGRRDEP